MKTSGLPFEDLSQQKSLSKTVPRKHEEFVHYIEYLATSPQLDHSEISPHILHFFNSSKAKPEQRQVILFALKDLSLPESFWASFLPIIKDNLQQKSKLEESLILALCAAPPICIIKEFNSFLFMTSYLENPSDNIRSAAFIFLYTFKNYIKLDQKIVQLTFDQLTGKFPKLVFTSIYLIKFYISVDFPEIHNTVKMYTKDLKKIIYVNGQILNINLLIFILKHIHPSIQDIISMLPHVSVPIAGFLIAAMPSCHDFQRVVDFCPDAIMPTIIDVINHPYCESIKRELLTTALQIIKMTQSDYFFDRILDHMFTSKHYFRIQSISLFADVANSKDKLQKVLGFASEKARQTNFFCDLIAVSSVLAAKNKIDIMNEALKLLTYEADTNHWKVAASCVAYYVWQCKQYALQQIQVIFDIVISIKDLPIRSIFLAYLSYIVPVHLKDNIIKAIKDTLFIEKNDSITDIVRSVFKAPDIDNCIPILIKVILVTSLAVMINEDDFSEIQERLTQPIFKKVLKNGILKKQQILQQAKEENNFPIYPFLCCDVIYLGLLASALYYPSTLPKSNLGGISRDFVEISPVYHAMTVEIASIVVPESRSLLVELRISSKGVVPSLSVSFNVSTNLTPPQVPMWTINGLNEGSKVTQTYSFTINQLINPYAMIHIVQDGSSVLDIKVCLPLIDILEKIRPDADIAREIWQSLHYQRLNVKIDDMMWVSQEGCIAVRNGVARSNCESLLEMIPSAIETHAVLE